jgi:hypothetical protein
VPAAAPPALRGAHPKWLIDEAVELGPAGPAAAWQQGVVMITRSNSLQQARLGKLSSKAQPAVTPIKPLVGGSDSFELMRGPSVLGDRAYWIAARQLWVANLDNDGADATPRPLASDAQNGTRVAVPQGTPSAGQPPAVAYIARNSQDPQTTIAKLWSESAPSLDLTPAGAAASSVALSYVPSGLIAWSMEGRTGMTPVHARELRWQNGALQALEDRVVWVGGASQSFSEIVALLTPTGPARAVLAMERDVSHFGLLTLTLSASAESETHWSLYPNGVDPAPLAVAQLCGQTVIARVKPQSSQGATPQELELVSADASSDLPPLIVAYAQRFFDISLASVAGGALLVTVADQRTWATTLRCRTR